MNRVPYYRAELKNRLEFLEVYHSIPKNATFNEINKKWLYETTSRIEELKELLYVSSADERP